MSKDIIVHINGVILSPSFDYITKGNRIVFKHAPNNGDSIDLKTITSSGVNTSSYYGTGTQTTFNLRPGFKFEVIKDSTEEVPNGYSVVDVDNEIDEWIRDNCAISEWKWADQISSPAIEFGMTRLIIKDSVLTFIATKWNR